MSTEPEAPARASPPVPGLDHGVCNTSEHVWPPMAGVRRDKPPRSMVADLDAAPHCETIVVEFESTHLAVRDTIAKLIERLLAAGLSAADSMTLEIVVAEATNNIVEHAYRNQASGWILLELEYVSNWIACRLTDGGVAMPDNAMPSGAPSGTSFSDTGIADLPEGGFGWSMIRELTDQLSYERNGDYNALSFVLSVSPPH